MAMPREAVLVGSSLLLLLLLLLTGLPPSKGGKKEKDPRWREEAFPGYSEESLSCNDSHENCKAWAENGECSHTPFYMLYNCPAECLPACKRRDQSKQAAIHGKASDFTTRSFATSGPGISASGEHFRRDPSLGKFLLPGQKLRGDPWLYMSSLGIGTHLGDDNIKTDLAVAASILVSVGSGWNVIDTASHYRNGRAESAVGTALDILINNPRTRRDMLFISTKAGNPDTAGVRKLMEESGGPATGVMVNGTCIDPVCLKASIETSLARMHLKTLDVIYLNNVAEAQLQLGRQEFMDRLEQAFAFLEGERERGTIQAYGMASTTCFRTPPSSPEHLPLADVVAVATKVAGSPNHGFRYIQLPVSIVSPEAWTEPWQPYGPDWWDPARGPQARKGTILEVAARMGVGVFGISPLEEGRLLSQQRLMERLKEVSELSECETDAAKAIQMARSVPLLLGSIVGHKLQENVRTNLQLSMVRPLPPPTFKRAFRKLTTGVAGEDL